MFRIPLFSLAGAIALAVSAPAFSKTYYVDDLNGNDAWSGELASPSNGSGPWRSLHKISIASLLPGDSVLLRCGGKWAETLRLNSSGTAAAPIRIGSYPASCSDKPAIDGARSVPESEWSLHSGNIYKARLGIVEGSTLIVNGALTDSFTGWRQWSANNNSKAEITSSCPDSTTGCLAFTGGTAGNSFVNTSAFAIDGGARYRVTFSIRAPAGARYGAYIRRSTSPWDTLGLANASLTGTGAWQTVSLPFTATSNVSNARLDIQLYQSLTVHIKNARVAREDTAPAEAPTLVLNNNAVQPPAHHPNRGHNPALPQSPYLLTAGASSVVTGPTGRPGSDYLVTGSDLVLPANISLKPGLRVVVRTEAWALTEHAVTSVGSNRIYISPITGNPLIEAGWGYYLTGALWMLDSPGEWHYDASTQTLYVWPAAGGTPGSGFAYSSLALGVDINRKQNIIVENIAIRNAHDAVFAQRAQNAVLRGIDISNMGRFGITAEGTVDFDLSNSQILYTGSDALYNPASSGSVIRDNNIAYSGVTVNSQGKQTSLPLPSFGAIRTGTSARISGNRIHDVASLGIAAGSGSEVADNGVTGYCQVLNDCAGIYFPGAIGGLVTGNLVMGGIGNRLGIPNTRNTSLANGLYLDIGSNNVIATDNTLAGGDFPIQFHNGYDNRIERNVLYGGRANLLWLYESSNNQRTAGNIRGNVIANNAFLSTNVMPALRQSAYVENTEDFASYQGNVYSTLLSTVMAVENTPTASRDYQLSDWQNATGVLGAPRNLDVDGRIGAPLANFAPGTLGSTLVVNGDVSNGTTNWTSYSSSAPAAKISVDNCGPLASQCILLTAGGGNSLVSSPRFNVTAGKWYRAAFDVRVGATGQNFRVKAIQSGPTNYSSVMDTAHLIFSGSTTLKRYAFVFRSNTTVTGTSNLTGARIDFMDVKPGQTLHVANFEIVPLAVSAGEISHALLNNLGRSSINAQCPVEDTAPTQCANYYRFPQGDKVVWPVTLAPLGAQVVFSQSAILPDTDRDGVPDSQDVCPGTTAGGAANAKGCGLGQ